MDDITRDGKPVLRETAKDVKFPLSDKDKKLAHDMMEYLVNSQKPEYAKKHHLRAGVGLAAPQVNVSERMLSVLVPDLNDPKQEKIDLKITLINPTIISNSVQRCELAEGEGCLSVDKDIPGYVPRSARITIRYQDFDGNVKKLRLKNYPAIVCQHEIDHLYGHLFYDRINKKDPFSSKDDDIIIY